MEAGLHWTGDDLGSVRLMLAHRTITDPILTAPFSGGGPFPGVHLYNGDKIRSLTAELTAHLRFFRYVMVEGTGTYMLRQDGAGSRLDDYPQFWGEGGVYLAGQFLSGNLGLKAGVPRPDHHALQRIPAFTAFVVCGTEYNHAVGNGFDAGPRCSRPHRVCLHPHHVGECHRYQVLLESFHAGHGSHSAVRHIMGVSELTQPNKVVTVFGSSRPAPNDPEYRQAYELGAALAHAGFAVCNGGFGGTMEASARGAREAGGHTIGVITTAFGKRSANRWIEEVIEQESLLARMMKLIELGDAYVVLKGGTGTLLELSAVWELMNKGLMSEKPICILGGFGTVLLEH